MGSFAGAKWDMLPFIAVVVLVSIIFFWSQSRILNMMLLGDEVAITLGRDLHTYRQVYLIISSLIIGFCSVRGGHDWLCRPLDSSPCAHDNRDESLDFDSVQRIRGSIFLVIADGLCRCIIPHAELPIGILISHWGTNLCIHVGA